MTQRDRVFEYAKQARLYFESGCLCMLRGGQSLKEMRVLMIYRLSNITKLPASALGITLVITYTTYQNGVVFMEHFNDDSCIDDMLDYLDLNGY